MDPPAVALLNYMTIGELYHTFADFFPKFTGHEGLLCLCPEDSKKISVSVRQIIDAEMLYLGCWSVRGF
jgi:hypothetical protein